MSRTPQAVRAVADEQAGVIARTQALTLGMTPAMIRTQLDAGRWRLLWPGIYTTFTGPVPDLTRCWAASLHAGRGAVLVGAAALWLGGALDGPPPLVRVCVPHGRSVITPPGVRVVSSRWLIDRPRPAARPERLGIEDAVLDEAGCLARSEDVVGLLLQVLQRRVSTPDHLRAALADRRRHRWRALVLDLIGESADGVHSRLEHLYRHRVERAHGLPRGRRNRPEDGAGTSTARRRYRDVRYVGLGLVVELDGALAHPADQAWRDRWRDNELTIEGDRTLRYGWREVAGRPCAVAIQVGAGLRAAGWSGVPHPCGPGCAIT